MSNKLSIEVFKEIATMKGGECLSNHYQDITKKLKFKCKYNHTWTAIGNDIKNNNHWCPYCSKKVKYTISDMKSLAECRSGKCLSDIYKNNKENLTWQCCKGHIWEACANSILSQNSWCPHCSNSYLSESKCRFIIQCLTGKKFIKTRSILGSGLELDGYCDELGLAFEYNGEYHYKYIKHFYKDARTLQDRVQKDKIKMELCKLKGIKLIVIKYDKYKNDLELIQLIISLLQDIKLNVVCDNMSMDKFYKDLPQLKEMHELAKNKNGICLSNEYLNQNTKYLFECHKGHKFKLSLSGLKHHDNWCAKCNGNKKHTIDDLIQLANSNNLICLSTKYINCDTKYEFKCTKCHTFHATYSSVRSGSSCPYCYGNAKNTIYNMKILASKKGGIVLSDIYINALTKLIWRCSEGHEFQMRPNDVQQGHWCPHCIKTS